jgi:hypothetical protein
MEQAMTDTFSHEDSSATTPLRFIAALAPRLPRMVAATAVVMFATFAGVQFLPQKFEAKLDLALPAGSQADIEADRLLAQEQLADIVSRLPPDAIAELRQNGAGVLDTTTLLRQRLMLTPGAKAQSITVTAMAENARRARSIVEATEASYLALVTPQALPSPIDKSQDSAKAAVPTPASAPMNADNLALLQQRLSLAWEERVRLEGRAQRVQSLIGAGNLSMLALDAENLPGLGRKLDELASLEAEQKKRAVTLLPNHPSMRTLKAEIDQLTAELDSEVMALSDLVVADRDAARRLEDGLRDQLASATEAAAKIDDTIMTGAISERPEPAVTALPRPVRTDLALGFAGSLAFLGQVGFFALTRPRRSSGERAAVAFGEMSEEMAVAPPQPTRRPAPRPASRMDAQHDWLASAVLPDVGVGAAWLGSTPQPAPRPADPIPVRDLGIVASDPEAELLADLAAARIIAVTTAGGTPTGTRNLLAFYQAQGKRVVLVDIATRRRGPSPGISDLSMGRANFADIIHGSGLYEAALIPWGRQAEFDPQSRSVHILVGALSDLYDVVVLALDRSLEDANAPLLDMAELVVDALDLPRAVLKAA